MFTIYTRSTPPCSYCIEAKRQLDARGHVYQEIDIKDVPGFPFGTVPQVFYKDAKREIHIGGSAELANFLIAHPTLKGEGVLKVKRLSNIARVPTRGSASAAGMDLYACLGVGESIFIMPGEVSKIPTGVAVEIPTGLYGRVAPRSGLGVAGIGILAGVIDNDYRGEVTVLATAHANPRQINHGDRVAQLILERYAALAIVEVTELTDTTRGAGGFGSTGK